MRELHRTETIMDMFDPINGGYRCVFFDANVVDRFPKGRKTRIVLQIDDLIEVQCGLQSSGDGRYFAIVGRNKLEGHTYELGQPISVVVYEDPNPLGVEIPETLSELIAQDEIIERVWKALTDGRKRTLCHAIHRIKSFDKQVQKALTFLEEEREKLVDRGKWK